MTHQRITMSHDKTIFKINSRTGTIRHTLKKLLTNAQIFYIMNKQDTRLPPRYFAPSNFIRNAFFNTIKARILEKNFITTFFKIFWK